MTKLSDLHCGKYRRERWELFGVMHGGWVRVAEYDKEHKAKSAFNDPTMRAAYKDGLAWTHRVVDESRFVCDASVPQFQLVMQMRGEDGEAGETIKTEYENMTDAANALTSAEEMLDCLSTVLVDLSTGRSLKI